MADDPIPTVICSGVAVRGTEAALRALDEGAVGIVTKPKLGVRNFLYESGLVLTDMVRSAARARIRRRFCPSVFPQQAAGSAVLVHRHSGVSSKRIVAIGASTGGTEALTEILSAMKRRGEALEIFQDSTPTFAYFPPIYYYQGRVREGLKSPGFAEPYRTYLDIRAKAGEDPSLADIRLRLRQ